MYIFVWKNNYSKIVKDEFLPNIYQKYLLGLMRHKQTPFKHKDNFSQVCRETSMIQSL